MNKDRRTLLVVHAHPDDEVFSTGGTLAKYAASGDRVVVVYATRGEAGEMHDPDRVAEEVMPRLGEIREGEARAACAVLGVTDIHFLGYRDSGMRDTEQNADPANFMNAPLDEAVSRLVAIIRATHPDALVTYDEDGGYGHPDHVMVNRVTTEAYRRTKAQSWGPAKLYYSARSREGFKQYAEGLAAMNLKIPWMRGDFNFDEYGVADAEITAHVDIAAYAPLKKAALAVHRTQIPADFFYLGVPDDALARFAGTEYFIRIDPPPREGEIEDDLLSEVEELDSDERQERAG